MEADGSVQYERLEDDSKDKPKVRKPRNTAFLNDDSRGGFFKKKRKRVVKKSKGAE